MELAKKHDVEKLYMTSSRVSAMPPMPTLKSLVDIKIKLGILRLINMNSKANCDEEFSF